MIIREAVSADSPAVQRINSRSLAYDDYPADLAQRDFDHLLSSPFYKIFVLEEDGELLGYINACDYVTGYMPPLKSIMALAIDPDHQGKGWGAALLRRAEEWAKEDGAQGVRLVSGYNRTGAHAFYEHEGYWMRKEQKNYIKIFE